MDRKARDRTHGKNDLKHMSGCGGIEVKRVLGIAILFVCLSAPLSARQANDELRNMAGLWVVSVSGQNQKELFIDLDIGKGLLTSWSNGQRQVIEYPIAWRFGDSEDDGRWALIVQIGDLDPFAADLLYSDEQGIEALYFMTDSFSRPLTETYSEEPKWELLDTRK